MAVIKVNSASELVSKLRADIQKTAMDKIIGKEGQRIEEAASINFTKDMVEEFEKTNPVYGTWEEGYSAKYSNKWFSTSADESKIGHFFDKIVAAGINNSRPPAPTGHIAMSMENTVSGATNRFMNEHFSSLTKHSLSIAEIAVGEASTVKRLKQDSALLERVTTKLADKIKTMMTATSYSYYAHTSGMTRWVYEDITLYLNASAKNIGKFITHSAFRTRTLNKEQYLIRFTIKDINLLEFLYDTKIELPSWQEAYVQKKMAIIVHDKWLEGKEGGIYRMKMHK